MAQAGYTPIQLYYSINSGFIPSTSNLALGELAINTYDGKLFYKDNSGGLQIIGTKGGVGSSNSNQVLFNNGGLIGGNSNFSFNGAIVTANTLNLTNALTTLYGGTGITSYTAGDLPYYASGTTLAKLGIGSAGYVLTSTGIAPQYVSQASLSVGSATTATTATNVAGGAAGSLVYQTGSGATTTLAVGTSGQVLVVNGGGTAPSWASLSSIGVTSINFGSTGLLPSGASSGAVTVTGTLAIGSGGTGQTTKAAAFNALSPITATGDIIIGNGANSATNLSLGAPNYVLTSNGTTVQWAPNTGIATMPLPITKIQSQSFGGF